METNRLIFGDCMNHFNQMQNNIVDMTLTDIPYGEVNRSSGGLRNLNKEEADILTYDLDLMLENVYRITKNVVVIFCGKGQFSKIFNFFADKKGTTRAIVWEKTNPSPMNGEHIYLSGVELAVWFKKAGTKTFNANCKNTVFKYPVGESKMHPTEKNHKLLAEIIKDNTNEGDLLYDPNAGSGSHLLVAKQMNRKYLGVELNKKWYEKAQKRLDMATNLFDVMGE